MSFCPSCGAKIEVRGKFCAACGKKLSLERKRLLRAPQKGMIGGVCEGIASFFELDPTFVRIGAIFGTLFWFPLVFLYLALWVLIPQKTENADEA